MTHYLIVDGRGTCAAEVEQLTGCRAHDTHFGILLEGRKPFDLHTAMAEIERALHPIQCTCGKFAIIHSPSCPAGNAIT